jgi:septum formation protein
MKFRKKKEKPLIYVERMALEKSKNINISDGDFLVTADTIVVSGGKIIDKTLDRDRAKKNIKLLSGKRHTVLTAFAVRHKERLYSKVVRTTLKMKYVTDYEIEAYLNKNEWQNVAGSYSIQGCAICFFLSISGCYSSVIGLPLPKLSNVLKGFGYFDQQYG